MTDSGTSSVPTSGEKPSMVERLGWRAHRRPDQPFAQVLGAGSGAFAVVATLAFAVGIASDNLTIPGVLCGLILATAAYVAGQRMTGPIRVGCVTILVLMTPAIWFFAVLGDGNGTSGGARGVYILTVLSFTVFYFFGWTRGRAVLLGAALFFLAGWVVTEVHGQDALVPFQTELGGQPAFDTPLPSSGPVAGGGYDTAASIIGLVIGLGALGAAAALDRRQLSGVATPFLVVGAIYAISSAAALGGNESIVAAGLLLAAAGAAVGIVGGLGRQRRGSIWIGVATIVVGLGIFAGDVAGDSALGLAGIAAVIAAGLGALGYLLSSRLGEPAPADDVGAS